ncbi:hypothetical protein SUGI_0545750 [Cryptomeria japonica]|nr:hypothetical protein SUGI_0545750 [Cryptomeria japonica]
MKSEELQREIEGLKNTRRGDDKSEVQIEDITSQLEECDKFTNEKSGMKLSLLAESVNVEFDFRSVMADKLDDAKPWMLQLRAGEVIAVNSIFQFDCLLYYDPSGSSLFDVLKFVWSLKPKIAIVVEQEANNHTPIFGQHVRFLGGEESGVFGGGVTVEERECKCSHSRIR